MLARFGPPGRDAHRLAGGDDDRPAGGAEPPPERRVQQTFDDPVVHLDPLVFAGKHLADELVAGLAAEGRVCTRLVVTAETDHGERSERAWYRAAGMSAPAMVERVRWQLDAWMASIERRAARPGVVLLRLMPVGGARRRRRPAAAVGRTVGRRRAGRPGRRPAGRDGRRPGGARAGVARRAAPRRPLRLGAGVHHRPDRRRRHRRAAAARLDRAGRTGPWPGSLPAPSPAVVPPVVQPAEVTDAGGRAVQVSGRGELERGAGEAGDRRPATAGDHRVGRAVAARRALVGAPPPPPPRPLPGRHRRRRRPPRARRAPPLVGRRLLRLNASEPCRLRERPWAGETARGPGRAPAATRKTGQPWRAAGGSRTDGGGGRHGAEQGPRRRQPDRMWGRAAGGGAGPDGRRAVPVHAARAGHPAGRARHVDRGRRQGDRPRPG